MAIDPGKMRDRILVQQSYQGPDGDNPWYTTLYRDYRTLWARVVYQSGREFREDGVAAGETRATFSIRYRDDLKQSDRIIFRGLIWDIQAIVPIGFKVGVDINARSTGDEYEED